MKKIVVILTLFVLCVNMFAINSLASDTITVDDTKYYVPTFPSTYSNNNKYAIFTYGDYLYLIFMSSSCDLTNFVVDKLNGSSDYNSIGTLRSYLYVYRCDLSNSSEFTLVSKPNVNSSIVSCLPYDKLLVCTLPRESFHLPRETFPPCGPIIGNPSFITTKEELAGGKFNTLKIDAGKFDYRDDEFGLSIFDASSGITKLNPLKAFVLNFDSPYNCVDNLEIYYDIPRQDLGIDLSNGRKYMFVLSSLDGSEIYNTVTFEVGGLTTEEEVKNKQDLTNSKIDEQTNSIKDQTQAIKDQTETNKNIFQKIGDILSYINPFSENFFVYKLIELLVDAIKSLFIPSDDFFDSYFTDLKDWFSDRLGFLFYPFEIVIDILTKILNINFANPVFNIPDLYEPFTNSKLMSATTFDLNSLVQSGALKAIHDIYLICVDAFIIFELVNLFRRKYEEVTTK